MNDSFNESISEICGLELATLIGSYKYSVFGNSTVVIEGHKGIVGYSDEVVSFAVSKTVLNIEGANLRIRCLEKRFAVVTGNIRQVGVLNDEK